MFKPLSRTAIGLTSLLLSATLFAADYTIDKKGQHASINFKASHLGYSFIIGRFNDFSGDSSHDKDKPGDASVNVTIQAKSIDTNHAARDRLADTDIMTPGREGRVALRQIHALANRRRRARRSWSKGCKHRCVSMWR